MGILEHIDLGTIITLVVMVGGFVVTVLVMRMAFSKDIEHNMANIKHNSRNIGELFTKADELVKEKLGKEDFKEWKGDIKEDVRGITGTLNRLDDKLDKVLLNGKNKS